MSSTNRTPTGSDLSQQIIRELLDGACRSLEGISVSDNPPSSESNGAVHDDENETMPSLSPIPFNAVVSETNAQRRLSGLTWSSRSRLSFCSIASFSSQVDASESTRSDCSSWCLGRGPLHIALARGSPVAVVNQLLSNSGNFFTRMRDTDGLTPLHLAMKRKVPNKEATLAVLEFDPYVVNLQDQLGRTPLHWAMKSGVAPEVIEVLLSHGPGAARITDRKECLPLHLIEKDTPISSIEKVLNRFPLAAKKKDFDQATPLHKLCRHIVENGGIKSHTQTHLLYAMAGKPDQEEGNGDSPLSIIMDDCVNKTDAFADSVEMNFDVLVNWCKQCTRVPVDRKRRAETVNKLTKLSLKLRFLNDVVEQLLSDTYADTYAEPARRPNVVSMPCTRPAKRNLSDGTSESAATVKRKQTRTDNGSMASSVAAGSISFLDCSKDGDTTEATALSTSHGASSSSIHPESSYLDSTATTAVPSAAHDASYGSVDDLWNQDMPAPLGFSFTSGDDTHQALVFDWEDSQSPPREYSDENYKAQRRNALYPVRMDNLPSLDGSDDTDTPTSSAATSEMTHLSAPPNRIHFGPPEVASIVASHGIDSTVKMYQRQIARETDVAKKVTLLLELYEKEERNKRMIKADGPKRFMKRAVKISRCFNTCFDGNLESFCAHYKKLDTSRFRCKFNQSHWKPKGAEDTS